MMLGPAARMAASSTGGDEEEKTAQPASGMAKAGRRAGRDRNTATTPTAANKSSTGNFMSSPRNQPPADNGNTLDNDDGTLLKPSRRAPPPASADDNSPPLSPTSPQQKTARGRVGDSLASEAEAAMGLDEPTPPPQPKTAGWGSVASTSVVEDTSKTNVQSPSATQPPQQPAFGRRNAATAATATTATVGGGSSVKVSSGGKHDVSDEITDITEIPDLEDEGKQDITLTVAANTHARSHVVQALGELDRQLEGASGLGGLGGSMEGGGGMPALLLNGGEVDVSLLLGVLCGVSGVDEGDGVWEFDALFSEVSSDMYAEMEHQDQGEGGDDTDDVAAASEKVRTAQSVGSKRTSITAK